MRRRHAWGMEPIPAGAETWHDDRAPGELIRERIIGENTLRHLAYLQQGLRAADAVVRIEVHGMGSGTGFLIAPDLMLTNNHVIAGQAQAAAAEITFFYQFTLEGPVQEGMAVRAADEGLLCTDAELDVSLVRLAHGPTRDHYPPLRPVMLEKDSRVAIIQHPGGGVKRISLQHNLVCYADTSILQYYSSTQPGSSGAPVFDDDFNVVAIHRGAVGNPDWRQNSTARPPADPKRIEDLCSDPDLAGIPIQGRNPLCALIEELKKLGAGADQALARVFARLVHLGEGDAQATRIRAERKTWARDAEANNLIDAFIRARLLVGGNDGKGHPTVEVAHEALLWQWPVLSTWIGDAREALRLRSRVPEEVELWKAQDRPPVRLWKHELLDPARHLLSEANLLKGLEDDDDIADFLTPEADWLLAELLCSGTDHARRETIGMRLSEIGDPRRGVGIVDDVPDIPNNHPDNRNDNNGFRVLCASHIHHRRSGYRQVRPVTAGRMRWRAGGWRGHVPSARRIRRRAHIKTRRRPGASPAAPHPRSPAAWRIHPPRSRPISATMRLTCSYCPTESQRQRLDQSCALRRYLGTARAGSRPLRLGARGVSKRKARDNLWIKLPVTALRAVQRTANSASSDQQIGGQRMGDAHNTRKP